MLRGGVPGNPICNKFLDFLLVLLVRYPINVSMNTIEHPFLLKCSLYLKYFSLKIDPTPPQKEREYTKGGKSNILGQRISERSRG
jgi:hypothetical protein